MEQDPFTDFLDLIVQGEERTYERVYQDAFHEARGETSDRVEDEDNRAQCVHSYREGLYSGVKLCSELCTLYGLITELLDKSHQNEEWSPLNARSKRDTTVIKTATDLKEMLTGTSGLLKLNDDEEQLPIGINYNAHTFEHDISLVRSKAKLLQNLLDVHLIEEATSQLSF
ncbi:unnamed protein product [Echinostoma caproni]|uniref:Yae1_N domain-containing protein n=1 Tax=Echinostoma caproni TaxID=27848 RepID=A0A183A5E5_9TREM|nr:unnamed protein product [Echinostoma caproni]